MLTDDRKKLYPITKIDTLVKQILHDYYVEKIDGEKIYTSDTINKKIKELTKLEKCLVIIIPMLEEEGEQLLRSIRMNDVLSNSNNFIIHRRTNAPTTIKQSFSLTLKSIRYEIKKWKSRKLNRGRPMHSAASDVLIGNLLKLLFKIEGKKPKIPKSSTVDKRNNIAYENIELDTIKRFYFLRDAFKLSNRDANSNEAKIKIILTIRKNINWN
tara:strand:+ start:5019 stop:5657 length:639 start_codon:yes stop_codon:yes gene_type:complete